MQCSKFIFLKKNQLADIESQEASYLDSKLSECEAFVEKTRAEELEVHENRLRTHCKSVQAELSNLKSLLSQTQSKEALNFAEFKKKLELCVENLKKSKKYDE